MKATHLLFTVLTSFILLSCGMGSVSFSTQKYTNFKTKKMYASLDVGANKEQANEIEAEGLSSEGELRDEDPPKVAAIKKAIQGKESIIIIQDTSYFELQQPTYDQFYNQLHGQLVPIHRDSVTSRSLVLHSKGELSKGTYQGAVDGLHYGESTNTLVEQSENKGSAEQTKQKRATFKERKTWPTVTKEEEQQSHNAKRTKQFFGASIGLFLASILAIILAIFTWSVVFIVLAVILMVLSQIFSVSAFIHALKYRKETRNQRKKRRAGIRFLTILLAFGMYYLLVTLVGLGGGLL